MYCTLHTAKMISGPGPGECKGTVLYVETVTLTVRMALQLYYFTVRASLLTAQYCTYHLLQISEAHRE